MNNAIQRHARKVALGEFGSVPFKHSAVNDVRRGYARDIERDIDDQIAVWVNEGGAGGEVVR